MRFITTVTQKGQVTLPVDFRRRLKIKPYHKVIIELNESGKNKSIQIKPTQDILDLAGTLRPKKNVGRSILDARRAFNKKYQRI